MRIIINEGRKVAVPTTRFESDALYYLKYGIMDDYGNLDIYQVGGNYQNMLEYHGFACYHGSDITNYLTPSNADVIILALAMKGKWRKIAMLRKKYPELFVSYYKPGFSVDCRELHFGDV